MKPKLEIDKGWTEAIIDDDCGFDKFYKVAHILETNFNLIFTNKLNHFDIIYWDFDFKGSKLVLSYNIYLGISISPLAFKESTLADNNAAEEIGTLLFQKLLNLD
ncbi:MULTISPECIES: hypothetical protein [unclassified Arcicella]|uniref:hypothetical protein n=1 Tax=unclassified Arcicella TaxID=2644986 RepID=UPI00285CF992|nr:MULTISPECIES: hypothetical protein [unclassified Arcicella]MDR6562855.1 hypothetical protein [Arcicella sp. BE51]MDR6812804.1 hypothetical protein [Arcicella sp. BE140]MDR6824116.1 hypothetical protein [Arcicella sp. BE139]